MILDWILFLSTFLAGYYLGGKGKIITEELKEKIESLQKPKPGVVNHLTEEQIADKKDPIKKGNLEAFNRFFQNNPLK
jgi:hypothetical protein